MVNGETLLSRNIRQAGVEARYDAACKKLLSHKIILAWIMKSCLDEYKHLDVLQIAANYIEGVPQVAEIGVHPDETNHQDYAADANIYGTNTESITQTEGTVTYDIRFLASTPQSDGVNRLILNVEAQNDFYPGYPIVKRGIYYCSRLISAQYGTEFGEGQYEKLKKVYSIWICMNPPKKRENSIIQYSMQESAVAGRSCEKKENYDLLTTVMICLGEPEEADCEQTGILRLLNVLLSSTMEVEEKKQILEEEYGIAMTREIESEVLGMCNLSKGILERGLEQGLERGLEQGLERGKRERAVEDIQNLMETLKLTVEQAMDAIKVPEVDRDMYKALLQ